MNLDSISKLFKAFSVDKPAGTNVSILIDVGSGKMPVKIPVSNILFDNGAILIKGEVPNMDVLNKSEETKIEKVQTFSPSESLIVEKVRNDT